jgi:hypothetical protein
MKQLSERDDYVCCKHITFWTDNCKNAVNFNYLHNSETCTRRAYDLEVENECPGGISSL